MRKKIIGPIGMALIILGLTPVILFSCKSNSSPAGPASNIENPETTSVPTTLTTSEQSFPTGTPVLEGLTPLYIPNGQWRFVSYAIPDSNSPFTYVLAYVERLHGTHRIVIEESWQNSGLGFAYPNTSWWTDDGKFLYVADFATPDGCGYFGYGNNIQKVDLENEEITPVAADVQGAFSVSPDGKILAYVKQQDIIFRNLGDGAEQHIHFDVPSANYLAGGITWDPSSDRIIFNVVNNPCSFDSTFAIYTASQDTASATMAVPFSQNLYVFESWKKGDWPVFSGSDAKKYTLDLDKMELRSYP
jgi:hypothetical protein